MERTNLGTYIARPEADRFWEKVNKDGPGGCWLWTSASNFGYGLFKVIREGSPLQTRAHRWAWENLRGPIPAGLTIDHLCRVRGCVNPDHLEVVTMAENNRRANLRSKQLAARTHCPKGHAFDEANTYWYGNTRHCRACQNAYMRQYKAKRRAATNPERTRDR